MYDFFCFTMTSCQIWSCYLILIANFENLSSSPDSPWNFRKTCQSWCCYCFQNKTYDVLKFCWQNPPPPPMRNRVNNLSALVTLDILGNQKQFFMLHRLILKVINFQLPTLKRFSTMVKSSFGGHHVPPPCHIGLTISFQIY